MKTPEEIKKELIEESTLAAANILIEAMYYFELKEFIETKIIDDNTGQQYKLRFEKLK